MDLGIDIQTLRTFQGYGMFFLTVFLTVILYAYIVHLYRNQKKGITDYEKYSNMALDDDLNSSPIEPREKEK